MHPLPNYARRVEYLESTGTQWIDTGVTANGSIDIRFRYRIVALTSANNIAMYGCVGMSDGGFFSGVVRNGYTKITSYYINHTKIAVEGLTLEIGQDCEDYTSGKTYYHGSQSAVVMSQRSIAATIPLFARRNAGGAIERIGQMRIYSFALYSSGALVRSFVPVAIGSVGYLLDRVSGRLFGNDGTGDFVLGPDTFAQGIVPTRMMPMGVRKKEVYPYAGINAFEFYGASSFTAAVFISSLRSGVSSTTIDWGDGTTISATTGKYSHNYAAGSFVATLPDDVNIFDSSNKTPYMANLKQIHNCVSQTLNRSPFRCRSSGILTGNQRLSVPTLPAWVIDSVTTPITVELFNFSSFSGNNGDWIFPVCKQLSTITIHGKTCSQMLAMPQFPYITNCMQPTSTDYINTQIVCDDGVIQYDLDTYGRTDSPTASKYKVTYT